MSTTPSGVQGITEADIANYLATSPGFFERHAELLATVQLASPHGQRAVSLQERQMEMLRDRIKGFERQLIEMIRNGQENAAIADKLHRWTRSLMLTANAADLPEVLVRELRREFVIPQAGIRVWAAAPAFVAFGFAQPVSDDIKLFAGSLSLPYCGVNSGFEAVNWLDDTAMAMSLALIPLREGAANGTSPAFGMLVLASPDHQRFQSGMGTDFLERIGELASAALMRLRAG